MYFGYLIYSGTQKVKGAEVDVPKKTTLWSTPAITSTSAITMATKVDEGSNLVYFGSLVHSGSRVLRRQSSHLLRR